MQLYFRCSSGGSKGTPLWTFSAPSVFGPSASPAAPPVARSPPSAASRGATAARSRSVTPSEGERRP
eukprot:1258986-Pyramimonas_sp.AAC.1